VSTLRVWPSGCEQVRQDRLWDVRRLGVCCVSASNLSTRTCLADDRRGCFLIVAETHLTSNTFLTCDTAAVDVSGVSR